MIADVQAGPSSWNNWWMFGISELVGSIFFPNDPMLKPLPAHLVHLGLVLYFILGSSFKWMEEYHGIPWYWALGIERGKLGIPARLKSSDSTIGFHGFPRLKFGNSNLIVVGGLEHFLFSHMLKMSSALLTNSYFSEAQPCDCGQQKHQKPFVNLPWFIMQPGFRSHPVVQAHTDQLHGRHGRLRQRDPVDGGAAAEMCERTPGGDGSADRLDSDEIRRSMDR